MTRELRSVVTIAKALGAFAMLAALYLAQPVIIPLILAMLLSFFLAPIVQWFERHSIPRLLASGLTVIVVSSGVALVSWAVLSELVDLTTNKTQYAAPLTEKFLSVSRIINQQLKTFGMNFRFSSSDLISAGTLTLAPHFFTAVVILLIVAVLTTMMLVHREDIRDRILRLMGERNVLTSTALLDQAGNKLSRFLSLAILINLSYSVLFACLLMAFGVPNPLVWAAAVAVLRFLPHIGVIVCILPPAALLSATTPGWELPIALVLSAIALDLFFINVFEPVAYGSGMGISILPLFIATLFWTWLWGLAGLALATPITLCLTVFGRMVPSLRIFAVMFDGQTQLDPGQRLCQRLIVEDFAGAKTIWNGSQESDRIAAFVVPCLEFLRASKELEVRDRNIEQRIVNGLIDLLQMEREKLPHRYGKRLVVVYRHSDLGRLLAFAAHIFLHQAGYNVRLLSSRKLPVHRGLAAWLKMNEIQGVVVAAYGPSSARFARLVSRRFRSAQKDLPIVMYNPAEPSIETEGVAGVGSIGEIEQASEMGEMAHGLVV